MNSILVIEDNKSVREEICDILKIENFNVLECTNGAEAIEIIEDEIPNLIISDIMMPIIDGYDLLKLIRQNPVTEMIPVILLSAKINKQDIRNGMNLGADDYLTKPVNADELINVINNKIKRQAKIENKFEDLRTSLLDTLPHEFRTPLNSIIGFADILRTRADKITPEKIKKYADIIFESGNILHRLNENYLLFSRLKLIQANINDLEKLRKINDYNTNTVDSIKFVIGKFIKDHKIEERFELNLDKTILQVDEFYFEKIIYELIDNALKFSQKNTKVIIYSRKKDGKYILSIQSCGRSMTNQQVANIGAFVQFEREEYAQNGLGLGLAIVKLIVNIYNGKFEIKNNVENFSVNITF